MGENCMNREFVVDRLSRSEWRDAGERFEHYNLYQMWDYAAHHSPESAARGVVRCAVIRDGAPAAMGQFRLKYIPGLKWGTAELEWGPLWHPELGKVGWEDLRVFLEGTLREFVVGRKLEVRIFPHSTHPYDLDDDLKGLLEETGFSCEVGESRNYDTVLIDLAKDLETLRAEFHPKWRNLLKKAEKSNLTVEAGREISLFDRFVKLYEEMRQVKNFATGVRIPVLRRMQEEVSPNERLFAAVASDGQRDVGASVWAMTGRRMLYFLAATHPDHRESSPGHLLQWEALRVGREAGLRWYDLGGLVDEGVSRFKSRMGGATVAFPRPFVARPGVLRSLAFRLAEKGLGRVRG